jgi:hypothetical protein
MIDNTTEQITETISDTLLSEQELTTVVVLDQAGGIAAETAIPLVSPYDFDVTRFAPAEEVPTFERFIALTETILNDIQDREQVIAAHRIKFTDEYPFEEFNYYGDELITWRVISRKPSNTSADGKTRPQRGFNFSYHLRSPKYPDKVIIVEARPIDHIIEFTCWSKRARLANNRALWLERNLMNNTWVYQSQGIDRFFFDERLADTFYSVGGQPLYQRPLRFLVRINEFRVKADSAISHITFESRTTRDSLV